MEQGVQNMSLDPKPLTGGLKLTLRMKNEHNYEVLHRPESRNRNNSSSPVSTRGGATIASGNSVETWRQIRKREKKNRKREISNSSTGSNSGGLKRLKLRLGDETMSTIDLDTSG